MLLAPYQGVPIPLVPKWPGLPKALIDLPRRISFPALHDFFHRVIRMKLKEDVHVVGHDDEAVEGVSLVIEVEKNFRYNFGVLWITEDALAHALIHPFFQLGEKSGVEFFR